MQNGAVAFTVENDTSSPKVIFRNYQICTCSLRRDILICMHFYWPNVPQFHKSKQIRLVEQHEIEKKGRRMRRQIKKINLFHGELIFEFP